MAIAEELVAGIISSVLAVLLVEIYLWLRRRYRQRALRWLIGTETASVVTPVYPWVDKAHPSGLLTTYDAIGLAYVLEACNRIGTAPMVTRSGDASENSPLDVIAIGGPAGNQITATLLKAYCPGFEILTDPETGHLSYRCGDRLFARTDDETFAFIVRLSPKDTGLPGTALLAWGHSAVSTASAGYYLARYPQALRKVGKGSFFVAISVRYVLGYRSFDTRPIDLTRAAFVAPTRTTARSTPSVSLSDPPESSGAYEESVSSGSTRSGSVPSESGAERSVPVESGEQREPAPRRRFGRSGRSEPAAKPSTPGRSRVAEALDDMRAGEGTSVARTGSSPVVSSTASVPAASVPVSSGSASSGPEAAVPGAEPPPKASPSKGSRSKATPSGGGPSEPPDPATPGTSK